MLKNIIASEQATIDPADIEADAEGAPAAIPAEELIETQDPAAPEVQSERQARFDKFQTQENKMRTLRSKMPASRKTACIEPAGVPKPAQDHLFHAGYQAGYAAATDDYLAEKVNLELFAPLKDLAELEDLYALGFEMGYFRKLAEILVF